MRYGIVVALFSLVSASTLASQQTESAEARVNAQRDELARIRELFEEDE